MKIMIVTTLKVMQVASNSSRRVSNTCRPMAKRGHKREPSLYFSHWNIQAWWSPRILYVELTAPPPRTTQSSQLSISISYFMFNIPWNRREYWGQTCTSSSLLHSTHSEVNLYSTSPSVYIFSEFTRRSLHLQKLTVT